MGGYFSKAWKFIRDSGQDALESYIPAFGAIPGWGSQRETPGWLEGIEDWVKDTNNSSTGDLLRDAFRNKFFPGAGGGYTGGGINSIYDRDPAELGRHAATREQAYNEHLGLVAPNDYAGHGAALKEFMDAAYPGTNSWEQLGAGGGAGAGASAIAGSPARAQERAAHDQQRTAEHLQNKQLAVELEKTKIAAGATVEAARAPFQTPAESGTVAESQITANNAAAAFAVAGVPLRRAQTLGTLVHAALQDEQRRTEIELQASHKAAAFLSHHRGLLAKAQLPPEQLQAAIADALSKDPAAIEELKRAHISLQADKNPWLSLVNLSRRAVGELDFDAIEEQYGVAGALIANAFALFGAIRLGGFRRGGTGTGKGGTGKGKGKVKVPPPPYTPAQNRFAIRQRLLRQLENSNPSDPEYKRAWAIYMRLGSSKYDKK